MSMLDAIVCSLFGKTKEELAYEKGREDALKIIRGEMPKMIKQSLHMLRKHLDQHSVNFEMQQYRDDQLSIDFRINLRKL